MPGRQRGRPVCGASGPIVAADDTAQVRETTPPLPGGLVLTPLERREFDFSDLNRWMREADQAIRRTKSVLDRPRRNPLRPHPTALDDQLRGVGVKREWENAGTPCRQSAGRRSRLRRRARASGTDRQLSCAVLDTVKGEAVVIDYPDSY